MKNHFMSLINLILHGFNLTSRELDLTQIIFFTSYWTKHQKI